MSIELPSLLGNAKSLPSQSPARQRGDPSAGSDAEPRSQHFTMSACGVRSTFCLEKQFYIFIGKLLPINRDTMPWKLQIGPLCAGMTSCPTGTIKVSSHVHAARGEARAFWPQAVGGPRVPLSPPSLSAVAPGRSETRRVPNQKMHLPVGEGRAFGKGGSLGAAAVSWLPTRSVPGKHRLPPQRPYRRLRSSPEKCLSSNPVISQAPRTLCLADAITCLNNYLLRGL